MQDYLPFAKNLALDAGRIIKRGFSLNVEKQWKPDESPVTAADLAVNDLVIKRVKAMYPGHGVLAEEKSDYSESDEFVWVCDPLDGTRPYTLGIPTCCFSLALVRDGEPIIGVIYDPFLNRMFWAEKGDGAFLNNQRIAVSQDGIVRNQTAIGFEWWSRAKFDLVNFNGALLRSLIKVIQLNSICYSGVLVACGKLTAAVFPGVNPHDTAALKIVVEEAGGRVTDFFGQPQRYDRKTNGVLASNGVVHNELLEMIRQNVLST